MADPLPSLPAGRLVVVGGHYWPEETGIGPYTTAVAERLSACGATVTALVPMPHYPMWKVFPNYRGALRCHDERGGVDVLRFRMFVPQRQSGLRRALYEASFFANAAFFNRLSDVRAVIGVVPNLSAGLVAARVASRHSCPFGLIVQDLTAPAAKQSGMPGGNRVAYLTQQLEGHVLRQADKVAIVSDSFRPYLSEQGTSDESITTLPNWCRMPSPDRDRHAVRCELGWTESETIVLHAGNMGLKQGLEQVIEAARLARGANTSLRFVLMGDGNQRADLQRLASEVPNVSFLGPQPDSKAFANTLSAADILLVNERSSVVDMSLPSKLTSYFAAGRPVLAAVCQGGATAHEVRRSGAGLVVPAGDGDALLSGIQRLTSDQETSASLAAAGRSYAATHLSEHIALARAEAWVRNLLSPR